MTDLMTDNCVRCGADDSQYHTCVVNGRELVHCDGHDCRAYDQPGTCEEMKDALEHWRRHRYLSGCSHGS